MDKMKPDIEKYFKALNFGVNVKKGNDVLSKKEIKATDILGSAKDKKVNKFADFLPPLTNNPQDDMLG